MKYIQQFAYVLLFSFLGELLSALLPLPIPSAVYGLILLFIALLTGLLKDEQIGQAADLMVAAIPLLLVPPIVKLLEYWDLIASNIVAICTIIVASLLTTFAVAGLVTKWIQKKQEGKNNG